MSDIAMSLNTFGILIDGKTATPGSLNHWLRNNGGYVSGSDLVESAVARIDPKRIT